MLLAAFIVQAAVAQPVAACRVPNDQQQRTWILERRETGAPDPSSAVSAEDQWQIAFSSRLLDQPRTTLRLRNASPVLTKDAVTVAFHSANGGRTIEWRSRNGASTIDVAVNFGLEVNVEADLDPAVEQMNTEGPLAVECKISSDQRRDMEHPMSEWIVAAGFARSVNLFQSSANRRYVVQNVSWGRELTRPLGPGALRGRFVWALETMPVFFQTTPLHVYGFGVAPVVWRWNFDPHPRWSAFGELSMGGLWTTDPVPEDTQRVNFTAHWGGGLRIGSSTHRQLVLGYRFQHISNGNQLLTNPGVNSHVVMVGWSVR